MMGQKAHPNSLRPFRDQYQGYARWNEGDYHQDMTYIRHVVKQCCYKTNLYTNNIEVIPGNRKLTVRCELIHFHDERRHWWDKIDYKLRRRKEWRRRKTEKFEILEPKRSELKRQFRRQFGYRYRFRLRPIVEALLKKEDKKDKSYRRVRVIRRMLRSRAIRACKIKKEKEKLLKIIRLKKLINDCTKKWGKKVKGKEAKANLIGATAHLDKRLAKFDALIPVKKEKEPEIKEKRRKKKIKNKKIIEGKQPVSSKKKRNPSQNNFFPKFNKKKEKKKSWIVVACKLQRIAQNIQMMMGAKKVHIEVKRTKMYTSSIPGRIRRKLKRYLRRNRQLGYTRLGTQMIYMVARNKASVEALSSFMENSLRSHQKRKKHYDFLNFLKAAFNACGRYKKIKGLKLQIKGRYAHRAKGRKRVWKYQLGRVPSAQLSLNTRAQYAQTLTGFGGVGLKAWICHGRTT